MLRSSPLARPLVLLAALSFAAPLTAQDGNISLGVFITIEVKDTEKFEASMAEHAHWHASQNDTWSWTAYQAMGGVTEYAVITPNHQWADFDNPVVDMSADAAEFARSEGAQLATSETMSLWEALPEYGNPPATPMPIVQVTEFQVDGNEEVVLHTMARFKEAAGAEGTFSWSRVLSSDGPPTYFVAVWANTFEELGAPGPTPVEIMRAGLGEAETAQLIEAFSEATTNVSTRIWIARPDLSYSPN